MPSVRGPPPSPSRSDKLAHIRARFYGQSNCPGWKLVQMQITSKHHTSAMDSSCRYPWVEGVLGNRRVQPFIHDTFVTIRHNGKEDVYHVFCQNHCRLPLNRAVGGTWRGNIVVMRSGKAIRGVVNMRLQDARRVDKVINE
ncbi:hypothetical protein M413DRAFT_32734 [Hebeloma cylindrosporum]|uniref:Uncharacterized protein n=1 Tax=Hebeloma cylindrosporum TaxID=76867 RepID=A0A0C2XAY1_HEBCY|nr:hypothetical protein M413DRAFT_32734 [Hebeloma cylindrosporum h7]